jgi:hypothetical protein
MLSLPLRLADVVQHRRPWPPHHPSDLVRRDAAIEQPGRDRRASGHHPLEAAVPILDQCRVEVLFGRDFCDDLMHQAAWRY